MDFIWFALGVLIGVSVYLFVQLQRRRFVDWKGWGGLLAGEALVLFCIAWSAASMSLIVAMCLRGIISTWVGAWGLMSRNAIAVSDSKITSAGLSPARILQNRQSSFGTFLSF